MGLSWKISKPVIVAGTVTVMLAAGTGTALADTTPASQHHQSTSSRDSVQALNIKASWQCAEEFLPSLLPSPTDILDGGIKIALTQKLPEYVVKALNGADKSLPVVSFGIDAYEYLFSKACTGTADSGGIPKNECYKKNGVGFYKCSSKQYREQIGEDS